MGGMTPTLPGMAAPPDDGPDAADPADSGQDGDSPEHDLQDAAAAIVAITKQGGGYLIAFQDGQEFLLRPGDAHSVGPVGPDTTYDHNDGEGPQNLQELHLKGALPASLHQMIQLPAEPTAAEAGLAAPPPDDTAASAPLPTLPGLPPPKAA
jgi:hypothetical protein